MLGQIREIQIWSKINFFHFLKAKFGQNTGYSSIYVTDTSMGDRCGVFRVVLLPNYFVWKYYFGPVNVKIWNFLPTSCGSNPNILRKEIL